MIRMGPSRLQSSELQVALRHPLIVITHPSWWLSYWRSGRAGLVRQMVEDSLGEVRAVPTPKSLEDIAGMEPRSILGRMGLTQEYLYYLVRFQRPETVIETGVYFGISTAFILEALDANGKGHLYSVDLPSATYLLPSTGREFTQPLREGESPGFAVPERLRQRWTLEIGDSQSELPRLLSALQAVDLFYHDSEHTYEFMLREMELAISKMGPGSLLAADDIDWNQAFQDFLSRKSIPASYNVRGKLGFAPVNRQS